MKVKQHELDLAHLVLQWDGRIPSELWERLTKRDYAVLGKWERKGWWESGVSTRSGWLTESGRVALTGLGEP